MSTPHTPGPWHIDYHGMGPGEFPIIDITGPRDIEGYADDLARLVVCNNSGSITPDIARANAQLMATAPELLATLLEAVSFLDTGRGRSQILIDECRAVIDRAEGRTP